MQRREVERFSNTGEKNWEGVPLFGCQQLPRKSCASSQVELETADTSRRAPGVSPGDGPRGGLGHLAKPRRGPERLQGEAQRRRAEPPALTTCSYLEVRNQLARQLSVSRISTPSSR